MSRHTPRPPAPAGAAIYIAVVQFLFVTTWTIYVLFLPRLLESAGLPAAWALWFLVLDQLVFMLADVASGVFADRVQRTLGRIGPLIVGATVVSCLAFLLLPHVVLLGGAAPVLALGLMAVWTTTSSALRAPPWVLLGKYAARPALPWLNSLTLMGLAAGGAVAPFLGVALKHIDPRLPFALSSLALLAATAGIVGVERGLARRPVEAAPPPQAPRVLNARHAAWMLGVLLLATAFQTHFSLNAAAQYLRFAPPAALEWLVPLFWVGFGVAMVPGGALCRRHGALPVTAVAALLGAGSALAAAHAVSLGLLIAAQLVAGGAWGCMLVAIYSSAAELGRSGREGLALGTMFAMLALATIVRIGAVLAGLPNNAALAPALAWVPVALWGAGGVVIGMLALRAPPPAPAAA
ncbi:MFS transporter [Methylibium sp.]|uniref:MFS transporter n=1 Tax=Methylibium sp. TaxID=2067992 RepID=UPI003D144A09